MIDLKSQEQAPFPIHWCFFRPRDPELPVAESDSNIEYSSGSEHSNMTVVAGNDAYKPKDDDQPVPLTQTELNEMTRDLKLSKGSSQLLCSRLKGKDMLAPGRTFY